MKKLYVYADFDWLKDVEFIGELGYESVRGPDSCCFTFSNEWLRKHGDLYLCSDLNTYPGSQYTTPDKDIFGCFSDVLPDRWGRTLLLRREQIEATEQGRTMRRLSSFDYLTGIDDTSRIGGFRFKKDKEGSFINTSELLKVPPLTEIQELLAASREVEKSEENNVLADRRWIDQLVHPGSSLGGSRPKASVMGDDKALYIAKFPSRKDDYDAGLWEHFSHLLAMDAGINAAKTQALTIGERYHTLLSRRFDRTGGGKRIHFASAMTLLGLSDGDDASSGHGYLDIVCFIIQHCTNVESNLQELYRRVAFNICIGNSDDHFRNHGFLLTAKGWTLSPAYDMNPSLSEWQSLLISRTSNKADLTILLEAHEDYLLSRRTAESIISEVVQAVKGWRGLAMRLGIVKREVDFFAGVLEKRCENF